MRTLLADLADSLIIDRPWLALGLTGLLVAVCLIYVPRFQLDASTDSLLLEDDRDLRYYSGVVARYGSENYLVLTYSAREDLFADETFEDYRQLRDELRELDNVANVISMLDVPLIDSPRTTIAKLQQHVPTLEDPDMDRGLARHELQNSPIYRNLLMSPDGNTTAMLVSFKPDPVYAELQAQRNVLLEKMLAGGLTATEEAEKDVLSERITEVRRELQSRQREDVQRVRDLMREHETYAELHLGGLPMIASDMVDYIRNDIVVFGSGIAVLLVVLLVLIFARLRWVVIALLCCTVSVLLMAGFLGWMRWPVTVVSSNFIALLLIFSLSLTVHLIQRYRELHVEQPDAEQRMLVRETLRDKARPCFFTAITTMVGFASLLVSGIRPVIDFGWMMVVGMLAVLLTSFVLFPACLMLLQPGEPRDKTGSSRSLTSGFARLTEHWSGATAAVCAVLAVISLTGMSRLEVENRFIDYFKSSTEIYQGMVAIDRELGGTAPFDVILDADPAFFAQPEVGDDQFDAEFDDEFNDDFGDEFAADEPGTNADLGATSYWYNTYRLNQVREVHDYLESLPETGKVLSMATTLEALEILNQDETPGTFFLSVLYNRLPESIKGALFDPYLSADGNQVRLSVRVFETDQNLRRDRLIREVRRHLVDEMGYAPEQVHVTGTLVLYNNVLQSLYRSQILTLGVVFLAIMLMFGLLFRSARIALAALLPSLLSVGVILGSMGLLGIPLDIMTITIAAISVGIGVDDSIHYIHRYRQEIERTGDAIQATYNSHVSVGRAMFYTSVIIVAGFSVLVFSNFIPSILFGLLTGLAMVMALVANLTLLPLLLRWWNVR